MVVKMTDSRWNSVSLFLKNVLKVVCWYSTYNIGQAGKFEVLCFSFKSLKVLLLEDTTNMNVGSMPCHKPVGVYFSSFFKILFVLKIQYAYALVCTERTVVWKTFIKEHNTYFPFDEKSAAWCCRSNLVGWTHSSLF